jgi:hypothetical protein
VCGWSRGLGPQDCLLAGGLLAAIASGWFVGVGAAVADWHYNSEVRLRVTCDDARGDRLAAGDRRTVMHPRLRDVTPASRDAAPAGHSETPGPGPDVSRMKQMDQVPVFHAA